MMAAGASVLEEVSWQERAFVTIGVQDSGTFQDFHGYMSEMGFSGGSKDVEGQALMNGGRFTQYSSQEDFEFSATLYITGISPSEASGIGEYFHGSEDNLSGTTGQYEYETSLNRDDFEIAVLFTTDSGVSSARDDVSSGEPAYRWYAKGAKLTEYEQNFDDQVLQVEVTFVIPPFDETGSSQIIEQEQTSNSTNTLSIP